MIRPDITTTFWRWREVIAALTLGVLGLWLGWLGGYVLLPLGLVIGALAAAWGLQSWRRLRFAQSVAAPGMVEIDEGQIGYLSADMGGFVGLPDLVELRFLTLGDRRMWRLKQADGQALLVPVDAAGAERLFDAFASLPGMDTQALVAALEPVSKQAALGNVHDSRVIWRRATRAALT